MTEMKRAGVRTQACLALKRNWVRPLTEGKEEPNTLPSGGERDREWGEPKGGGSYPLLYPKEGELSAEASIGEK